MKTSTRIIAITAAAFALGTSGLAFAGHSQGDAGCMGAGKGQGMGRHQGGPGGQRGAGNPADVAARLAAAKTSLAITTAQEPAWQAFEGMARQHAEARQAMRSTMQGAMQGQAASADHAAQREAMMKQREAHRAESEAARQALYAVLTPEQKAIADKQLGAGPGHRMAMHRH
jgi:LTXXQ motif family protein